jgi:MbtH protein
MPDRPSGIAWGGRSTWGGGTMDNVDRKEIFRVVVNNEEQYSIWPDDKKIPEGWREAGKAGERQECLDYISEVWTDMRPLSLRKAMEGRAAHQTNDSE